MDVSNFRPISLLSQLDKLFESVIHDQMMDFLQIEEVLDTTQYGFRQGKGCMDALCMLLNKISMDREKARNVVHISFDISKAFDTVSHQVLLQKLDFLGFRGNALNLLKSFFYRIGNSK